VKSRKCRMKMASEDGGTFGVASVIDIFPVVGGALVKIRCNIDVCLCTQRQHNNRIKY
jgi:hypothetical protein